MVEELEELEAVLAYKAKTALERGEDEAIPLDQAVSKIREGKVTTINELLLNRCSERPRSRWLVSYEHSGPHRKLPTGPCKQPRPSGAKASGRGRLVMTMRGDSE